MERLKVNDLMTTEPLCIGAQEDVGTLFELMAQHHIRHMPVIDSSGDLIGVVTQRDLAAASLDGANALPVGERRPILSGIRVSEIMTATPETIEADDDVAEAGRLLLENKMGCLPVVQGTRLIGIITESDFVRYVVENEASRERREQLKQGIRRARV